ncbi:hypothetical protein V466_10875 [Pseudomonas mandelii PD30]|uniref:Uncharacterized protein n=1 Tax=Pseudomonas mandelii PD30 TaxID=1419583 RepID=A0A059L3V7_9PSED|nr:hypothetical protein V466_10875 [Pseudomonas mandelii PD30]
MAGPEIALIENYQALLGLDDSLIGNVFKGLRVISALSIFSPTVPSRIEASA